MRARWLGALVVVLGIVTLAGPTSPAEGKPGYVVFPGFRENSFSVEGTNGFTITVSHIGRRVELTASGGDGSAIFLVGAAKPSPDGRIEARFPGRGRVSVRFRPVGGPHRTPPFDPPACDGGGETDQRGTFSGTIRFRGEESFTQIAATRARGNLHQAFKEVCESEGPGSRSAPYPSYSLSALTGSSSRIVSFSALRPTPGNTLERDATFFANSFEQRHGMSTVRVAVADADLGAFTVAGPPARPSAAAVAPPPPFQGTASFELTPEGRIVWEGTLAVDFPGEKGVALTGPFFHAKLCRDQRCTNPPIPGSARRGIRG